MGTQSLSHPSNVGRSTSKRLEQLGIKDEGLRITKTICTVGGRDVANRRFRVVNWGRETHRAAKGKEDFLQSKVR